jgi:hypothetical protein
MKFAQAGTSLALVGSFMGPERLPLAILKHQYAVVARAQSVGQLRTVAPANHVRLTSANEDFDGLVGGMADGGGHDGQYSGQHQWYLQTAIHH